MADRLAETEASRTRLLADLAHELRTPLATLEAYIDGLEDDVVAPSEESYATMRGQVARLRRLATDLRESAAADEHALHLDPVVLDAAAAAGDAVAAAAPRYLAKGVELTLQPGPTRPDGLRGRRAAAARCSRTSSTTPCATPRPAATCASPPSRRARRRSSR